MKALPGVFTATIVFMVLLNTVAFSFEPRIKLSGRKDLVLSHEIRRTILEIGDLHLAEKGDAFLGEAGDLSSPFTFSARTESVLPVAEVEQEDNQEPAVPIHYKDSSVLAAVASSFSKKVRGSIARGAIRYLQLDGGTLLKPGASFPVRIPLAKQSSFTLTVSEINAEGYTLKLGTAMKQMSYDNTSPPSPSSIKFLNE
ncbi:MAG: hypothetical protein ACPG3X_00865 [Opitutales bacterium]